MKKLFLLLTIAAAASCTSQVQQGDVLDVVPYPNEVCIGEGLFEAKGASVTYDETLDEASVNVINLFAQKLSEISGKQSPVAAGVAETGFVFQADSTMSDEAYVLDIKPEKVLVRASGLRGFNYAIQTIKQMLPVEIYGSEPAPRALWTLKSVTITSSAT